MSEKMICPECRIEMNFHAEKLVYFESATQAGGTHAGQVEEMHSCPGCGRTESRLQPKAMRT